VADYFKVITWPVGIRLKVGYYKVETVGIFADVKHLNTATAIIMIASCFQYLPHGIHQLQAHKSGRLYKKVDLKFTPGGIGKKFVITIFKKNGVRRI
jgi:hypothetical protein